MGKPELIWVDKGGWPVTYFKGRPITNFIRWMLHAKRRAWWFRVDGGLRPCVMFEQPNGSWKPGTYDPRPATAYPSHVVEAFTAGNASSGLPAASEGDRS